MPLSAMRATNLPVMTQKEDPKDAQVASHRLLTRAGFIRKQAAGLYVYLPFGWDMHRKIETIIREEMNRSGGVEVKLPVITPGELWRQSGRWQTMGPEMMRMTDRHSIEFALGPTHEESITWLASTYLQSYKQLPINLYQIGTKYRDEIRPRYGLIRCREFVMKDAYSFHADETSLDETYSEMRDCYRRIFERCGLKTLPVEADSGNMGGSGSEEFMVPSEIGEETLLLCEDETNCKYRSNVEKTSLIPGKAYPAGTSEPLADVETPNQKTIEEVASHLQKSAEQFIKTVIYTTDLEVIVAFLPGDRNLSETKLKLHIEGANFDMASETVIRAVTGARPGFAGPVRLKIEHKGKLILEDEKEVKTVKYLFDKNLQGRSGLIGGANKDDFHTIGLQEGRDFTPEQFYDLAEAEEGDICPKCNKSKLKATRGIEVGHIFKLGYKYSKAMQLSVLDVNGKPMTPIMGCYGIGVGRTIATIVEQNHDDKGIVWPEAVSPYLVYLIGMGKNPEEKKVISEIYEKLTESGISVFFDDRDERAGVKFNDADLVGFPYQVIAGKNFLESGRLELKNRRTQEKSEVSLAELISRFGK